MSWYDRQRTRKQVDLNIYICMYNTVYRNTEYILEKIDKLLVTVHLFYSSYTILSNYIVNFLQITAQQVTRKPQRELNYRIHPERRSCSQTDRI